MKKSTLVIVLVAAFVLVTGALILRGIGISFSSTVDWTWIMLACGIGGSAVYGIGSFRGRTREDELPVKPIRRSLEQKDVDDFIAAHEPHPRQIQFFMDTLMYPKLIFSRISEQVEPNARSVKVTTTYSAIMDRPPQARDETVPSTPQADFVVPLHLPIRGIVVDGLRITGPDGKRISTLDSRRQALYSASALRVAIEAMDATALAAYLDPTDGFEAEVLSYLAPLRRVSDSRRRALEGRISTLPGAKADKAVTRHAQRLLVLLLTRQVIAVTVPVAEVDEKQWPSTFRFIAESRVVSPTTVAPNQGKWQQGLIRAVDTFRLALGVPPMRIYFALVNAVRTHSYHVEVSGAPGTYYAASDLIAQQGGSDNFSMDAETQFRRGQRRAHVYIGRADWNRAPLLAVSFHERSPGSFAAASLTSSAAATVIVLLSRQEMALKPGVLDPQSWLLPALLAVPIATAALAGLDSARSVRHPSLLSRGINIGTVLLCLSGFVLASLRGQGVEFPSALWTLLQEGIIVLAVVSVATWILRLSVENHFRRRDSPE